MSHQDPPTDDRRPAAAAGEAPTAIPGGAPAAVQDAAATGHRVTHGKQARWAVAALAVVAAVALFWPRGDGSFEAPGGFLVDGGGRPQTLGQRMAPVTLVHFWATWCPPCLTEIPALLRLIEDYSDRSGFDVVMIAVDDDADKVETFVGERAAMMLYDDWNVAHRYGTRQLPETYLVVDGTVLEKWEGAQNWDDAEIRARLDAALGGDGAPEVAGLAGAAGGSGR